VGGSAQSGAIKNVSVPGQLWDYLGNRQVKFTESFTPWRWATGEVSAPNNHESHLAALRLAVDLFDSGRMRAYREPFVALLSQQRAMRAIWFRSLVHQVTPQVCDFVAKDSALQPWRGGNPLPKSGAAHTWQKGPG
jgi:hypothetical protein